MREDMGDTAQKLLYKLKKAEEKRAQWAENDQKRDAGLQEPEHVRKVENIAYADSETEEEKRWHLADIYYPDQEEAQTDGYPVIISVHGGGWFYGDKELYKLYTMTLASYGFAVVNFNYRLSPEYPYPAGFSDVCSLVGFVSRNARKYHLDLDRLFMVGDSAGAQLVSQYCIYAASERYQKLFPFGGQIPTLLPKKIALNCGIYDLGALFDTDDACDFYVPSVLPKDMAAGFFRVLDYMTADFPETYLMLSVNDPLAKDTFPMQRKLQEKGIPFVFKQFGEDNVSEGHVFHLNLRSENAKRVNREETAFFLEAKQKNNENPFG